MGTIRSAIDPQKKENPFGCASYVYMHCITMITDSRYMHRDDRDEKIASSCISRPGPARHVATKNACTHADLIAQPLHACGGSWFELVKATMDAEPVKRPCLTQTTLFGQVVVADADIYSKPANEYEHGCYAHVSHGNLARWRRRPVSARAEPSASVEI